VREKPAYGELTEIMMQTYYEHAVVEVEGTSALLQTSTSMLCPKLLSKFCVGV
jgi:hypothetical protein